MLIFVHIEAGKILWPNKLEISLPLGFFYMISCCIVFDA